MSVCLDTCYIAGGVEIVSGVGESHSLLLPRQADSSPGVACHVLCEGGHVDTRRIAENTSPQVLLLLIMFSWRCGGMLMYFLETPGKRVWASHKDVSGSNKSMVIWLKQVP